MNKLMLKKEEMLNQLLKVLDADIEHLEMNIEALNQLRMLVVKRDDQALHHLLSELQLRTKRYHDNELKRQHLRAELAVLNQCNQNQITLSQIGARLEAPMKYDFIERKLKLQRLTSRLKKEFTNTQRLLKDCARFNRMLLQSIFKSMKRSDSDLYNANGAAQRQTDTVFMNVQL